MKSHTRKTTYQGWMVNQHRYVTTYANGDRYVSQSNSVMEMFYWLIKVSIFVCLAGFALVIWVVLGIYGAFAHSPVAEQWFRWSTGYLRRGP